MSKVSSSTFLGLCPHRPKLLMNCKWSVRTQTSGENGSRTESNEVNRNGASQNFFTFFGLCRTPKQILNAGLHSRAVFGRSGFILCLMKPLLIDC